MEKFNLAFCYNKIGKKKKAREFLDQALEEMGDSKDPFYIKAKSVANELIR